MKPVIYLPEIEGLFCDINSCAHDCFSTHQLSESLSVLIEIKNNIRQWLEGI